MSTTTAVNIRVTTERDRQTRTWRVVLEAPDGTPLGFKFEEFKTAKEARAFATGAVYGAGMERRALETGR